MTALADYQTSHLPTWCPGCQNYLLLAALKQAFVKHNLSPHNLCLVYDIGCNGNMADFINTYGIHTLHGRSIPVAMGIKLANPNLTVVVIGGDGGIYGEGLNHLAAAVRSNADIKVLVANNYLYSLTTGQTSPTTPKGSKTKSTPLGSVNQAIDPQDLITSLNPQVLVAKADSRDPVKLNQAVDHVFSRSGFALLDISQTCIAFGKQLT